MSDRRPPESARDAGDEDDGARYRWLYGAGADDAGSAPPPTRPVRRPGPADADSRPDQTQVMRTQPRPATAREQPISRPTPPPVAPAPTPRQPGPRQPGPRQPGSPGPDQSAPRGRRWRPRFRLRYLPLLLLLWLGYLVAVPVLAWHSVDSVDYQPGGDRPADQPGTTYLLVGSDSRKGLTAAQRKEFHTGGDVGQRTDTIMLLHTGSGPNLLMSIPRDSQVAIPGHGTTKINAAYAYGGARLLTPS